MEDKLVALVPMRHHSERVPGKNYRPLAGLPLYVHILRTLRACPEIDQVVVDTDSPIVQSGVAERFPEFTVLERPQYLRDGSIPMNEVLRHDVEQIPAKFYLQTHSTNPLMQPATVQKAIREFFAQYPVYDSLFSVTRLQTRLWASGTEPLNHNPHELLRTQDLPPVYEENSCLYIFERESFLQSGNRLGENPLLFEMDRMEAVDIDDEFDFRVAETLLQGTNG